MTALDPSANGHGASDEADRLAQANYADRAAAALPDARAFNRDIERLLGFYDPRHVTIHDMRQMRDDYTIKMAMHYRKAPLISADYAFQCDDPRISRAAQENYDEIHVPFMKIALNKWDYGFQGAIKNYEYGKLETTYEDSDSGAVKPVWPDGTEVNPILMGVPISLVPEHVEPNLKDGRFAGIRTTLARLSKRDDANKDTDLVPVDWSLWFAHQFEEEFRNWAGRSELVPVYPIWYSFWANWYNRDRNADQDADPALQIWYPPGDSWVDDPGEPNGRRRVSNREQAIAVGQDLRNGATVVWPSDVYIGDDGRPTVTKKWEAGFLTGGENLQSFNDLLDRLEVAKFRGCMVPEQSLIEAIQGTGARNVAGEQIDLYMQSLELESAYLDRIFNRYYLRPWVEANFGEDAPRCAKVTTGFKEEDTTLATTLIEAAFAADPNALPIKFEEMLEQQNVPMYSKKEQEEREAAVAEAQQKAAEDAANADVGTLPGEQPPQAPGQPQASPDAVALSASRDHLRTNRRPYERERIVLDQRDRARREHERRERNVAALAERLSDVVHARYQDAFEAVADAVADADVPSMAGIQLARRGGLLGKQGVAERLARAARDRINDKVNGYRAPLEDELASMYHAAGAAEIRRLGLSAESWDVGRQEIQDWASERAGGLIVTMDKTIVEAHVRPWLTKVLEDPDYKGDFIERAQGIPVSSVELAAQLTDQFTSYPRWMAERVVRTEATTGYNAAAADVWERAGVQMVTEFDGLGGKSGKSDPHCLARDGRTVTLDQFRIDNRDEHPNGTLGATPVLTGVRLRPIEPAAVLYADARRSGSAYAVTDEGLILSQRETGRLMAD